MNTKRTPTREEVLFLGADWLQSFIPFNHQDINTEAKEFVRDQAEAGASRRADKRTSGLAIS